MISPNPSPNRSLPASSLVIASLVIASLALIGTPTLRADEPTSKVIDNQGRLISARSGLVSLGDDTAEPGPPALLLDVVVGDETATRVLPGTEDAGVESAPLLLHDRQRDRVTVLWETLDQGRKRVQLVQLEADDSFVDARTLIDVVDDGTPIIRALTSDAVSLTLPNGTMSEVRRRLIHFMWWDREEQSPLRYLPLVIVDGEIVDPLPSVAVDELYTSNEQISVVEPSDRLLNTITLDTSDQVRLRATFVDRATHRVTAIEVAVEPLEAILFAERIHARLTELYGDLGSVGDGFAVDIAIGGMMSEIVIGGADLGLDDTLVDYLAENARTFSLGYFALNPDATAETWLEALHAFLSDLLTSIYGTASTGGQTIQIGGSPDDPAQLVDVRMVVDLPAPTTGDGATRTYVGRGGTAVVIGWHDKDAGAVHWVEATGDPESPWTEPSTIMLREDFDLDEADTLLRNRVH